MVSPAFELSFEVFCICGNGLCSASRVSYNRGYPQIEVEPCEKCLAKAKETGHDEGYDIGYADGREDSIVRAA